jgi:predicted NAD/FAD-binding protein
MPRRRGVWASWNYLAPDPAAARARETVGAVAVTYWMNRLQSLAPEIPLFVTLNPPVEPRLELVHAEFDYDHPVYDRATLRAQAALPSLQGARRVWFAGAWLGYGFHEDGLRAGLAVARALGAEPPWPCDVPPAGPLAPDLVAAAGDD